MPIRRDRIEEWSPSYHLLKYYVDFAFHNYYDVEIHGIEKIDFSKPLIFAPNHQNALMDALALLCLKKWQPVFLARSDVFNGRFLTKMLTFFKMLPVYRIRDGFSTLQQNDLTFRKTLDVFRNLNGLVILPEGSHLAVKRLRPLKKGIARIAFQAEEATGFNLGISIIPVGLDFEDYHRPGSRLLIVFGDTISVQKFAPVYKESQPHALNALIGEVAAGMKQVMIHISNNKHYTEILELLELKILCSPEFRKSTNYELFQQKRSTAIALDKMAGDDQNAFEKLIAMVHLLSASLWQHNLRIKHLSWLKRGSLIPILSSLILLITLPLFLAAGLNIIFPAGLAFLAGKKAKDHHFISSFRFVVGLLAFPMFFILQTLLASTFLGFGISLLAYAISFPLSVWFAFKWRKNLDSVVCWLKLSWVKITKPDAFRTILQQCSELLQHPFVR